MIFVGNKQTFAIESDCIEFYDRLSLMALGYFVIYVGGRRYGVYEPDATTLALAVSELTELLQEMGKHQLDLPAGTTGLEIANAYQAAFYALRMPSRSVFGKSWHDFKGDLRAANICFTVAVDSAFDDGSRVFVLDVPEGVRVIGSRTASATKCYPSSIRDITMPAHEFYGTVRAWRDAMLAVWESSPKIIWEDDGPTETIIPGSFPSA